MKNKNGAEMMPIKQFKMMVRFQDGEKDGKPIGRVIGFAIEAKTEIEAKETLKRWLQKALEMIEENEKRAESAKNGAI